MKHAIFIVGLVLVAGATALLAGDAVAPRGSAAVSFRSVVTANGPVLYPYSIAAGDLNGDGFPDMAVVSEENNQGLAHALGKGDGRFGPWSLKGGVGDAPSFVLLADVDGDGNLDAVTTDITQSFVTVAFGDGRGHLSRGIQPNTGTNCTTVQLVVADLNGDGVPDIVGTCDTGPTNPGKIFVLLGEGQRKFKRVVHFGSGGHLPIGIAVGDLNHDGIPDLVVANWGQDAGPYGNLAVLLGKGNGTFGPPTDYQAGIHPAELTLVDLNGDGNLDVAVSSNLGVYVFLGKGDGTFSSPEVYHPGDYPSWVLSADFNGDGIPDLAVANNTNPNPCHVTILLGNGDGTF